MNILYFLSNCLNKLLRPLDVIVLRRSFFEERGGSKSTSPSLSIATSINQPNEVNGTSVATQPMTGSNVYIQTNGLCIRREIDLKRFSLFIEENGYSLVSTDGEADAVIFWGCAFNDFRENESLELARKLIASHSQVYIMEGVASQCRSALVDLGLHPGNIVDYRDEEKINAIFGRNLSLQDVPPPSLCFTKDRASAYHFIQVAKGCDGLCTYCVDKAIVGEFESVPLAEILSQAQNAVAHGSQKIFLLADNVADYGSDIGLSVYDLLEKLVAIPGKFEITMQELSVIPRHEGSYDLLEKILAKGKIKAVALGIQSGSDKILQAMQRNYTRETAHEFLTVLSRHGVLAHIHIMLGFPAESRTDFLETLTFLTGAPYTSCSVFKYQDRLNAPSYHFEEKVSVAIVEERMGHLLASFPDATFAIHEDKIQIYRNRKFGEVKKLCTIEHHRNSNHCLQALENIKTPYPGSAADLEKAVPCLLQRLKHRIIHLRRGLNGGEDWLFFKKEVEDNIHYLCSVMSTRWLVSICDSFVDYGSDIERSNALLLSSLVNWERVCKVPVK